MPLSIYDKTPMTPMTKPPTTPANMTKDPLEICPEALAPLSNRLVETTAADPPPEPVAARLPVAEAETAGVWGVTVFVGAETPFNEAATLNGTMPLES
jgi:hypothetical protein